MKALHTVAGAAIGVGIFGGVSQPASAWFVCAVVGAAVIVFEAVATS